MNSGSKDFLAQFPYSLWKEKNKFWREGLHKMSTILDAEHFVNLFCSSLLFWLGFYFPDLCIFSSSSEGWNHSFSIKSASVQQA